MTRSSLLFLAVCCLGFAVPAQAANNPMDQRLINNCAARTDARMESMTLGKLEQIRNYEFSLRIALAQLAGGSEAMSNSDWQQANADLRSARTRFAQICGLPLQQQG